MKFSFNEIDLLSQKIINKLNEDAMLLEAESYDDGFISSKTDRKDDDENKVLQTLTANKNKSELEKNDAREVYRNIKYNPNVDKNTLKIAKQNYERKIADYKKADLTRANYKLAVKNNINEDIKDMPESLYNIVKGFDDDLNDLEESSQEIQFANNELTRLKTKLKDIKDNTNKEEEKASIKNKEANSEYETDKKDSIASLENSLQKRKENIELANDKKIEQLKKSEETKINNIERRIEKVKNIKANAKAELSDTSNTETNNSQIEEQLLTEDEILEGLRHFIVNKRMDHVAKKQGKVNLLIQKYENKINELEKQEPTEKITKKLDQYKATLSELKNKQDMIAQKYKSANDKLAKYESKHVLESFTSECDKDLKDLDNLISLAESVLNENDHYNEKDKSNLYTPEIQRILNDNTNDLFLKRIIQSLKEELEKENPNKIIINSLILKYNITKE